MNSITLAVSSIETIIRKIKNKKLKLLVAKLYYKFIFKYNYSENLTDTFNNLLTLILSTEIYELRFKSYIIKIDRVFNKILNIENDKYLLIFDIDTIEWRIGVKFTDKLNKKSFDDTIIDARNGLKFETISNQYIPILSSIINEICDGLFKEYIIKAYS